MSEPAFVSFVLNDALADSKPDLQQAPSNHMQAAIGEQVRLVQMERVAGTLLSFKAAVLGSFLKVRY